MEVFEARHIPQLRRKSWVRVNWLRFSKPLSPSVSSSITTRTLGYSLSSWARVRGASATAFIQASRWS